MATPFLATDPVGLAATECLPFALGLHERLTLAAYDKFSREERRAVLERVFFQWASLCRTMAALELAAPRSAEEAYARAAAAREIAERAEVAA